MTGCFIAHCPRPAETGINASSARGLSLSKARPVDTGQQQTEPRRTQYSLYDVLSWRHPDSYLNGCANPFSLQPPQISSKSIRDGLSCSGKVRTTESSRPLNLMSNGFTSLPLQRPERVNNYVLKPENLFETSKSSKLI